MIEHVHNFLSGHGAQLGLLVTIFLLGTVMRGYGRHLERRTREHSVARSNPR